MDEGDRRSEADRRAATAAWSVSSYLLSGMLVYGGLGWLLDRWTGHDSLFTPIGVIVGLAAGLYLSIARINAIDKN
jgi:ATP synthase protein I